MKTKNSRTTDFITKVSKNALKSMKGKFAMRFKKNK